MPGCIHALNLDEVVPGDAIPVLQQVAGTAAGNFLSGNKATLLNLLAGNGFEPRLPLLHDFRG